jgi:predicted DNA-binding protein with PD1-like motif
MKIVREVNPMEKNPVSVSHFKLGRIFLLRLPYDADLLQSLTDVAIKNRMQMATFFVIGAVKKAAVEFYDQQEKVYRRIRIEENLEIVTCMGNVSLKENKTFVHCHATFANRLGETLGGHLAEGTTIFAAEAHFQEVLGSELVRELDPITRLALWRRE